MGLLSRLLLKSPVAPGLLVTAGAPLELDAPGEPLAAEASVGRSSGGRDGGTRPGVDLAVHAVDMLQAHAPVTCPLRVRCTCCRHQSHCSTTDAPPRYLYCFGVPHPNAPCTLHALRTLHLRTLVSSYLVHNQSYQPINQSTNRTPHCRPHSDPPLLRASRRPISTQSPPVSPSLPLTSASLLHRTSLSSRVASRAICVGRRTSTEWPAPSCPPIRASPRAVPSSFPRSATPSPSSCARRRTPTSSHLLLSPRPLTSSSLHVLSPPPLTSSSHLVPSPRRCRPLSSTVPASSACCSPP